MTLDRDRWTLALAEGSIVVGTALGFALSYSALRRLAGAHGYDGWEAALWPLVVDFVAVATTALAMALAHRQHGPTGETWTVAGAAALISLSGNIVSAWGDPIAMAMHAWAAAVYIALWHAFFRAVQADDPSPVVESEPAAAPEHSPESRWPRASPEASAAVVRPPTDDLDDRENGSRSAWSWPSGGRPDGREGVPALVAQAVMTAPSSGRPAGRGQVSDVVAAMTAAKARETVVRMVGRARTSGREVTVADVRRVTGRSERQARRLLAAVVASNHPRRPRALGTGAHSVAEHEAARQAQLSDLLLGTSATPGAATTLGGLPSA